MYTIFNNNYLNNINYKKCNNKNNTKNNTYNDNILFRDLESLVNLIYIFLISVLLLNSILNKDKNSLIHIIVISLLYIGYKNYMYKYYYN
jgi:hypothetical protein